MTLARLLKVGVVVVVLLAAAAMFYPPVRLGAIVLAGGSPACSFSQAVRAEKWWSDKIANKDRILAVSKHTATDGELEEWQTPHGTLWTPSRSRYGLPFHLAEQDMDIYGDKEIGVRPGDIVLDCGANIGTFTRKALTRGAKTVVAIEPAPENLNCLRRTFASEIASGRVIVYPKGVWDKDDMLTLHIHEDNSAADSFVIRDQKHADDQAVKVPLTTIDKMVAELKLPRVDFIKMDIEGAEPNALRGGRQTIAQFHPRLAMSVYHEADHAYVVPRIVRETWSGYRTVCGACEVVKGKNEIRPDILFFH